MAALLGAACGLAAATWPVSLENGQALAGRIPFVANSAWNVYLFRLWALINQLTAGLLALGCDGPSVAMILAALTGALSFAALAAMILAFGGAVPAAVLVPGLIYHHELKGIGFSYPIDLMRTPHIFGIIGFSYVLLVLGLFGVGRRRTAWGLAGLAPAVHPTWGAFCLGMLGLGSLLDAGARAQLRRDLPPLALGLALSAASYALQRHLGGAAFAPAGPIDMGDYQLFLRAHDVHRLRFEPLALDVLFFLFTVVGLSLALMRKLLPPSGATLGKCLLAGLATAAVLTASAPLFPDFLPLQMLMAPRFFNLEIILAVPLFFALTTRPAAGLRENVLAGLCIPAVWAAGSSDLLRALVVAAAFGLCLAFVFRPGRPGLQNNPVRRLLDGLGRCCSPAAALLLALFLAVDGYYGAYAIKARFHDGSNDSFYTLCQNRPGPLLPAAGLPYPQWNIARPVIFFPAGLDLASYFPDLLPGMRRLALAVYGQDILVQPPGPRRSSLADHRTAWETRSLEDWRELGQRFGFTDILVPADWQLSLPLVGSNCAQALYALQ